MNVIESRHENDVANAVSSESVHRRGRSITNSCNNIRPRTLNALFRGYEIVCETDKMLG